MNAQQFCRIFFVGDARSKQDNRARGKKSWLGIAPSQLSSPHTNADKNPKKIGLVQLSKILLQKSALAYSGQG